MSSIGIRELRQRASDYLRRVEAGETIEITDRGRPVARLTPIGEESTLERLRSTGALARASTDRLPEPLPATTEPSSSQRLAELRADER